MIESARGRGCDTECEGACPPARDGVCSAWGGGGSSWGSGGVSLVVCASDIVTAPGPAVVPGRKESGRLAQQEEGIKR